MSAQVWQELIERASSETDMARQHLMRHRAALERAEHQHKQLQLFRDDYATQASSAGNRMSLSRMMHLRSFVDNLDFALAQLEGQMNNLRELGREAQRRLSERRSRQLALENLLAVREAKAKARQDRREQSAIDDLIQANLARRR